LKKLQILGAASIRSDGVLEVRRARMCSWNDVDGLLQRSPSNEVRKSVNRYIIIANGEIKDYSWHKLQLAADDVIVCADGGAKHALAMGIIPHVVLGDFDSLGEDVQEGLRGKPCRFFKFPEEKDMTDTELALRWCLDQGAEEICLLGALGTRMDHSLSNILLAARFGAKIKIINEHNEIALLTEEVLLEGSPGDRVSVIPISAEVRGIFTKGLKYILKDDILTIGTSRGISNEMVGTKAEIKIRQGMAVVIKAWDRPRGQQVEII